MKKLKIGITLYVEDKNTSVWHTGIEQNALNFAKVLSSIKDNHDVFFLNVAKDSHNNYVDLTDLSFLNVTDIKLYPFSVDRPLDVLFILGGELADKDIIELKSKYQCKIVYYNCGSQYQNTIKDMLFKQWKEAEPIHSFTQLYDQFWSIPQVVPSNYFNKILHKSDVKTIPFVWDPMHILKLIKEQGLTKEQVLYKTKEGSKRISIMEPNKEWIKTFIYPILIVEDVFRQSPELINTISINNIHRLNENKMFNHFLTSLDIWKSDNIQRYLNGHWATPIYLEKFTDIIVSHQDHNPLNYFYLDCLFLQYPLVHNADLIKSAGYYYNDFNGDEGAHQLEYALKFHDSNIEAYNEKSLEILWSFSANNQEVVSKYDDLLTSLFINT